MSRFEQIFFRAKLAGNCTALFDELFHASWYDEELKDLSISDFSPARESSAKAGQKLLAEWLFFLHCLELPLPNGWQLYQNICIWFDLPLKKMLTFPGAVAMFPLAGKNTAPQLVRLYSVLGDLPSDMRSQLPQSGNVPEQYRLFCAASMETLPKFDGNSWQLAAVLATRALISGDFQLKRELARQWIVSGVVWQDLIHPVELGNKMELLKKTSIGKKWMLPKANFTEDIHNAEIYWVPSVARAWRLLQGKEVVSAPIQLQQPITVEHILVGASNTPILSSIFQLAPKKIILWYTEQTSECAVKIQQLILLVGKRIQDFHVPEIVLKRIPSDDISELLKIFEEHFLCTTNTIINFTGGNRMIGFAAILAAQKKSKIQLVYRDKDQPYFQLQLLDFSQSQARSNTISIQPSSLGLLTQINWDHLFSKNFVDENSLFL